MAGFEVRTNEHLIRSQMWTDELKTLLLDELMANRFVRTISVPADAGSSTINLPSMGEAEIADFVEGQRVKYNKFDTGNYQFTFDQYKYSANSMSAKFKRDSFYSDQVLAAFVPRQHRALMVDYETLVFSRGNSSQTAANLNTINSANHRWVASGTNNVMKLEDFAKAQFALKKANVPLTNLTAVVDPSVIYTLQTQANITNLMSPMPSSERIVSNSTPTGMKYEMNIFGFDVYSSNYLPQSITETVNSVVLSTNGVANFFFSAAPGDTLPWVGAWRQLPTVDSKWNMDTQEWEYMTICEYGLQGDFRAENMVIVLSDAAQALA